MDAKDTKVGPDPLDWDSIGRAALGSAILAGVASIAFGFVSQYWANRAPSPAPTPPLRNVDPQLNEALSDEVEATEIDPQVAEAAALLGVDLDTSAAKIRAALRARIVRDRLHPDHGGDGEEARRLIAARDLLLAQLERTAP